MHSTSVTTLAIIILHSEFKHNLQSAKWKSSPKWPKLCRVGR